MKLERSSGVLLHPTSLPGKFGIGTLGKEAYDFIDFLIVSHQKLWQIYPLGPTGYGDSPYQCFSAFAGNPLLISLEKLCDEGFLSKQDLKTDEQFDDDNVDYGKVINFKFPVLKKAFEKFQSSASAVEKEKLMIFCEKHFDWLEDYSLFMALKSYYGGKPWIEWPNEVKLREFDALQKVKEEVKDEILFQNFLQYIFFKQWHEVRSYANQNNIKVVGDIPIFVAFDSADAWSNPEIFFFDENRNPTKVAGVPPDYFSETGQLWGNPLYNWDVLKKDGYSWWIERLKACFDLFDIVRLDHFRGFAAYWAVPAGEQTAINGTWEPGPYKDFFKVVINELGKLPIIAEDLGEITPDVEELRDYFKFPGMKILQFAFDTEEESDFLPHNFTQNCVVYTGTHDNDTILGWYHSAKLEDKNFAKDYLNSDGHHIAMDFVRAAWASVASISIAPLQDILGLGTETRINTPGKASGNWMWRFKKNVLKDKVVKDLKKITKTYCR